MKTFQFTIKIDADNIDQAVIDLTHIMDMAVHQDFGKEDADKMWRFTKQRVNDMEVIELQDPYELLEELANDYGEQESQQRSIQDESGMAGEQI